MDGRDPPISQYGLSWLRCQIALLHEQLVTHVAPLTLTEMAIVQVITVSRSLFFPPLSLIPNSLLLFYP